MSGTGPVVEGVEFTNGWCALRWISSKSSICLYRSLDDVKAIHGHGGKTELIVHDFESVAPGNRGIPEASFEAYLTIIEELTKALNVAEESPGKTREELLRAVFEQVRSMLDEFERKLLTRGRRRASKSAA